jgi:hypothetical protein
MSNKDKQENINAQRIEELEDELDLLSGRTLRITRTLSIMSFQLQELQTGIQTVIDQQEDILIGNKAIKEHLENNKENL